MLDIEKSIWGRTVNHIAGIDEVGRGPLCGPVVACSVILPENLEIEGLIDSKKLTPKNRNRIFPVILDNALSVGVGTVHENRIDDINILEATIQAMRESIQNLSIKPDFLLVDGNIKKLCEIDQESIIKGDQKSMCIAAASVVAKVTRDRMMEQYAKIFPGYGIGRNMGYGTSEHMTALKEKLSTPIHRQSFKPVSDFMPTFDDISDHNELSIKIAASKLVKDGYEIHSVCNPDSASVDILASLNGRISAYCLDRVKDRCINREAVQIDAAAICEKLDLKKDITNTLDISVISIKFSNQKPRVSFRKI